MKRENSTEHWSHGTNIDLHLPTCQLMLILIYEARGPGGTCFLLVFFVDYNADSLFISTETGISLLFNKFPFTRLAHHLFKKGNAPPWHQLET